MDIATVLILNCVIIAVLLVFGVLSFVGMVRAEWKVYKLGGKSWAFRTPKEKRK